MNSRELFLANAHGEKTDRTPIWIMRQAGRYLPEYREYRKQYTFEQLAKTPEAAATVTAQPIDRFDLDAAIIFSDILFILEPWGVDLVFNPGPTLSPFLEDPGQVSGYTDYDPREHLGFVGEVIQASRKLVGQEKALLGFSGAPFTVFCYLCGLKSLKDFYKIVRFLLNNPDEGSYVLDLLTKVTIKYLQMQLEAGVDAVQIFDTWAGELTAKEYEQWCLPYTEKIVRAIRGAGGIITVSARNNYHLLDQMNTLDANIVGLDWKVPMAEAKEKLAGKTLQGNLNPYLLLGPPDRVADEALELLETMRDYPGYIFNLGHGILQYTPVETVKLLVETVKGVER